MWFRILLSLALIASTLASNILIVIPTPGKSHALVLDRLTLELAKKGHDVTLVTPFKLAESHPKLRQVIASINLKDVLGATKIDLFGMKGMNPLLKGGIMPGFGAIMAEMFLKAKEVQDFLENDDTKYDVMIGEIFLNEAVLAGFSHKYKVPLIAFGSGPGNPWYYYLVGNPSHPAFEPQMMLESTPDMCFKDRLVNTLYYIYAELLHGAYHIPKQDKLMRQYFGDDLPPIRDIIFNTSFLFTNSHPVLTYPKSHSPNVIEVGGIHVEDPKPLPKDLQKFLDDSKMGAILFSMGSNLQSADMPPEKIKLFLDAFSRLKQNVLWKFETDNLPNQPKNVHISKWLPQRDILAHPNLKLFITHGGFLSTTEALYRGVPIIGLPIFGDQPANMKLAQYHGHGIALDFDNITSDSLYETIKEVLTNPRYRETVKERSAILKDNPNTALDRAIFWIEYVIRHKGAHHFKSTALNLTWYQYYLLDVIFVCVSVTFTVLFATFWVVKLVFKKLFGKKSKKSKKE